MLFIEFQTQKKKSLLNLKPKSAGQKKQKKTAGIKSSSLNQKRAVAPVQIKQSRIPTGFIFENKIKSKVKSEAKKGNKI